MQDTVEIEWDLINLTLLILFGRNVLTIAMPGGSRVLFAVIQVGARLMGVS